MWNRHSTSVNADNQAASHPKISILGDPLELDELEQNLTDEDRATFSGKYVHENSDL
jgi:hypothetical protein